MVETEEPFYDRLLKKHPLLKTHSNKEHNKEKLHPPNPEGTEELVAWMIHSVPAWRLSNWDFILHIYLFLSEFLWEILDFHLLLILSGKYYLQRVIFAICYVAYYRTVLSPLTWSCIWNVLSQPVFLSHVESVVSYKVRKPHRLNSN